MSTSGSKIFEGKIRPNVDPIDWSDPEPGDERYSPNQMISAWKAGVTTGIESAFAATQEWFARKREENITKAAAHTHTILQWLIQKGLHPISARLNEARFDAPEVLVLLPPEEYAGRQFEGVYDYVGERENEWRTPEYMIHFSFSYVGENFNEDLLKADGYLRYHTFLGK